MLKIISSHFEKEIQNLTRAVSADYEKFEKPVKNIIEEVRKSGDAALAKFTQKFDGVKIAPQNFEVKKSEWQKAVARVPAEVKKIIKTSAKNISEFHKHEKPRSWLIKKDGKILGKRITPIEKIGIYVPGGRALYPSTVLMNAIPAKIAGVAEIIMATPPDKNGKISPLLLLAAQIAGVDRVFKIGGAQAIAALAVGSKHIPKVDKVVGPGNIFVTLAKKLLFGEIGIDGLAGPSELLILAEDPANPNFLAADLLAQAEHDPAARVFLVTPSLSLAKKVNLALEKILKMSRRRSVIKEALKNSRIFLVKDLKTGAELSNKIAPEHLEIVVKRPDKLIEKIKNAGAVFVGPYTPTVAGDYLAGPSHTLPTAGTSRFASGLGVADFLKTSSIIYYTPKAMKKEAALIEKFALLEGLEAHAISAMMRRVS